MPIRGRLPLATKVQSVVEWRFPNAHAYWDDPGKLMTRIEEAHPALKCTGLKPDGFHFERAGQQPVSASFYWNKAAVTWPSDDKGQLAQFAQTFWESVCDVLRPSSVDRVGHRLWLCYEMENGSAEALQWLEGKSLWAFADGDRGRDVGTPSLAGTVLRTKLADGRRRLRLEINAGTLQSVGKEYRGVIVDADFVVEKPSPAPTSIADFINSNAEFARRTIEPLFRS